MVSVVRITVSLGAVLACASPLAFAQPRVTVAAEQVKAPAQRGTAGNVNISPKRVVFGDKERGSTVILFNQGAAPATYALELVDHFMDAEGAVREPKEGEALPAGVRSARSMIGFTPRRVTLAPGQSQIVKLRVQRPQNLAAGEYRTHLTVTTLPPADAGLTAQQAVDPARGQLAFRVVAVYRLSIPLIVRQGPADVQAKIASAKFIRQQPDVPPGVSAVDVEMVRQGASSLYGDVEVHASNGKKSELVGRVRGAAVYPEVDRRMVRVSLARPVQRNERLSVTYRDDDTRSGQPIAQADVAVR
jgi:P pilus assembly chaperone PapD